MEKQVCKCRLWIVKLWITVKLVRFFLILKDFDFFKVVWKGAYAIIITCCFSAFCKLVKEEIALEPGQYYISLYTFCIKKVSIWMKQVKQISYCIHGRKWVKSILSHSWTSWNKTELQLLSRDKWEISPQLTWEAKTGEHVLGEVDPLLAPCWHGKVGPANRETLKQSARKKRRIFKTLFKELSKLKKYFSESFCKSQQEMVLLGF